MFLGLAFGVFGLLPAPAMAATTVALVSAGANHTCALITTGGVKCWGWNYYGQLGNGTTRTSYTPVAVRGLSSRVITIHAGVNHTCAAMSAGGVECWGYNAAGQLGNGAITASSMPVAVSGLRSRVVAVTAGANHTCALTSAGGVKCWGSNAYGQLGNGASTAQPNPRPVDVIGLSSGGVAISAGANDTCALTSAGGVKCWGWNDSGQLGNGTTTTSFTPVDVSGLSSGVVAISAGDYHTCALTSVGGVKCWGDNAYGQLGNGTDTYASNPRPVDVSGLSRGVVAISAGADHECALTSAGGVKCWGWNDNGQLGNGTIAFSSTPIAMRGLNSGVRAITAGAYDACAVTNAGGVKCWGFNDNGQLGNGTTTTSHTPVDVIGLADPPRITRVSQSAKQWQEGSALPRSARTNPPVGTTFSFTLNERARVQFSFTHTVSGRRAGGRCVAQTKSNQRNARCQRTVTVATLNRQGHAGRNSLHFEGRINREQKLPPGSYTLRIIATANGVQSPPAILRFTS
jgi:alpha-tubulin suppressor-like RCC1 family protein